LKHNRKQIKKLIKVLVVIVVIMKIIPPKIHFKMLKNKKIK